MKRVIIFLLALLGFGIAGCEPQGDYGDMPVPEYGAPYTSFHDINK